MNNSVSNFNTYDQMIGYAKPSIFAGLSIGATFGGFVIKTRLQKNEPIPAMTKIFAKQILVGSLKAVPNIGFVVGTQLIATDLINEKVFDNRKDFVAKLASATAVGVLSVPSLTIFNGLQDKMTVRQSLTTLSHGRSSLILACSITVRETSFLFSNKISAPLALQMKQVLGDNVGVECATYFTSGAIGSVVGHPFDTLSILALNKNFKIVSGRQLMNGGAIKAVTLGVFNTLYNLMEKYHDKIRFN